MSNTKQQIVSLANGLIRTKGYHGFSYADISKPLGVKNAAVHYHYPSKVDLGLAVIDQSVADFANQIQSWENESPTDQVISFIRIYEENDTLDCVCFIGALAPTHNGLPEPLQIALKQASIYIRSWLGHVLQAGLTSGEFSFKGGIQEKADQIVSSLLAGLILNRISPDDVLANIKACILTDLNISLPKDVVS